MVANRTRDGKKIKLADTDTTNDNPPHKLLINRLIPEIISVVIPMIKHTTAYGVAASGGTLHAVRTIIPKEIVTDAALSETPPN